MTFRKIIPLLLAGIAAIGATAQTAMPTVNADHSVTFRLTGIQADEVLLKGSFIPKSLPIRTPAGVFGKEGKYKMVRDGNTWSYTTPPLSSEIYTYYFEADDERLLDPQNDRLLRDVDVYYNYFIIGGGIADDYVSQPVAHGEVTQVWYDSSIEGFPRRRMTIYTPPHYADTPASTRYPVLYLLHGSGGDENAWIEAGCAAHILDNLIAQGRCEPMIVVMPNGIANRAAAPGANPHADEKASAMNVGSMFGKIERAFVPDIVGYVDSHYRTAADKPHRAIAGLSLGGLHTLFITANNPDLFDYVGLFSAQTTNTLNDKKIDSAGKLAAGINSITQAVPFLGRGKLGQKVQNLASQIGNGNLAVYDSLDIKLQRQFETPPRLYYIACGKDDFVKKLNDDLRLKLSEKGYPYVYHETDGGHSWENWRKYLVDFLPRLFRQDNTHHQP